MTKNILITGGAGFIGSHFVDLSLKRGYKVIVLDALTYSGNLLNLDSAKKSYEQNLHFQKGLVQNSELVQKLLSTHQPSAIVHFAAESHVDRAITGPEAFIKTNIEGSFVLLECTRNYLRTLDSKTAQEFRFIHISTDEVFGSLGESGSFNEKTAYSPRSPYSASKAAADHLARAWFHTYKIPVITTYCSNNYGPRQHPEKLIPHLVLRAISGQKLPIYGDGGNRRDWLHVIDHCEGVMKAIENGAPGETYCLGGRNELTNIEVAHLICEILDEINPKSSGSYRDQIEFVADRPGHDWRYSIDPSHAEQSLGFVVSPKSFREQLNQTIRWYLENLPWTEQVLEKAPLEIKFDWSKVKT